MPVPLDVLSAHLDYTAWASARLVSAAAALTPEQLTRDFGTADRNVLGTLVHVYAADRIWLARIYGDVPARLVDIEKDMHLEVLLDDWPPLLERWHQWLATLNDPAAVITYKDMKGKSHQTAAWQIVLHVVNHGTHHRGQVSGFLRAMGLVPLPLDLMAFYREKAATAKALAS